MVVKWPTLKVVSFFTHKSIQDFLTYFSPIADQSGNCNPSYDLSSSSISYFHTVSRKFGIFTERNGRASNENGKPRRYQSHSFWSCLKNVVKGFVIIFQKFASVLIVAVLFCFFIFDEIFWRFCHMTF